jgi:cytochrome c553
MIRNLLTVGIVLASTPFPAAAVDAPARPAKLGLCASCHGDDGRAGAEGVPRLARQDETYLRDALAAYRNGHRDHDAMRAIAGALSTTDIEQLARWYATQGPP